MIRHDSKHAVIATLFHGGLTPSQIAAQAPLSLSRIAVLISPRTASLVVDAVRGFATWQGTRLKLRQRDTVAALYDLAIGKFGRTPLPGLPKHRAKTIRTELAKADLWTRMEDGRLHIVMGWDSARATQVTDPVTIEDDDDLRGVEPVKAWKHVIEKAAERRPIRTGQRRDLTDGERSEVFRLRDQGYRAMAIAAMTRLPYDAIARIVTKPLHSKDIERLAKRNVTQCHALSRKMSRSTEGRAHAT